MIPPVRTDPVWGRAQYGPTVRPDWTKPKTGSLGLDGLGLDQSAHTCNFDIVS
jgi:hypothetical protein